MQVSDLYDQVILCFNDIPYSNSSISLGDILYSDSGPHHWITITFGWHLFSLRLIAKYETISVQLVCLRGFVRCWVAIAVGRGFAIELMEVSMAAVRGLWGLRKRKILGEPSNKRLFIVKVFPRTLLKQNRGELRENQLAVDVFSLL